MKPQKIAAIDIGSNSIKLAVVEAVADTGNSFAVLHQERKRVRLGEETLHRRRLSAETVERAIDAVASLRATAGRMQAETIFAVATAAAREAQNSADFVKAIEAETGVCVKVLSDIEEARLIGIAAAHNFGLQKGSLLNIDIGGGSTELSLMRAGGVPERLFSMKIGAVGLTRKFLFSNPPSEREIEELRREVANALEQPRRELQAEKWQTTSGTSGTILNLAALLNFQKNDGGAGSGEIQLNRLVGLNEMLAKIPLEERARLPRVSPQRAEVLVGGGQILEAVMRALDIQTLKPCFFALREGVIIDYLQNAESESATA